jgi:hypothetical protein
MGEFKKGRAEVERELKSESAAPAAGTSSPPH